MSSPLTYTSSRTPNPKYSEGRQIYSQYRSPFPANGFHGSIPNTPPKSFLTEYDGPEENCLDIRQVDHDAIINDLEIKNLSRNHSFHDRNSSHQKDPLFDLSEQEDGDDEFGEFDEVERLVNNPLAESRLSMLAQLYEQDSPEFSALADKEGHVSWLQKLLVYVIEGWIGKTIIKPIAFVLFMLFWIIKEPIIRVITFLTMIVSAVLIDPLVYFSSLLPHFQQWMPTLETRHRIAHVLTITMLTCASLYYLFTQPSHALGWIQHQQFPSFQAMLPPSYFRTAEYPASVPDFSGIHKRLAQVENQFGQLKKHTDTELSRLQSSLHKQSKHHEQIHRKVWSALDQQQAQLDTLQKRISQDVRQAMANQLPEMILVHTDQHGRMTLSPQFYQHLKDNMSWSRFLEQNEAAISDYMRGKMDAYLEQQKKEGAIISKERFMKLLANDLTQQHASRKLNTEASVGQLVEQAIQRYHQDVLNTPDFALYSRGGFILHSKTSHTYDRMPSWMQVTRKMLGLVALRNQPENAIHPAIHVGQCWSMAGQEGTLGIMLSEPIYVQSVTLEHPSPQVLLDKIDSAPQLVEFYGLEDATSRSGNLVFLGKAYYDINKQDAVQTFDVYMPTRPFQAVIVKIKSNWGNTRHTDLYRVRFHGIPA
ncbi:UNC-like C-terminal-domain-containing protein [Blakeslea trispora]|nr:UNC-like C-terminal-domain-containing protein [Blakeslea trispora]